MPNVLLVAAIFLATHVALSEPPLRGFCAHALGERPFVWSYSVLAVLQLIWLSHAVGAAAAQIYWHPPQMLAAVHWIALPLAILLAVAGFTQNNPTAAVVSGTLARRDVGGILAVTRHPVIWSILLWSVARLLVVDRAPEAVQYAVFAGLAAWGILRFDAKLRAKWGDAAWADFAARTSNLPFLAMAQGRAHFHPRTLGWLRWTAVAVFIAAAVVLLR